MVASRRAGAALDVLEERDEAMTLEGELEVSECGALQGNRERGGDGAVGPIDDQRSPAGERKTQRVTHRLDQRAIDDRDQWRLRCRDLDCLGQRCREPRVVPDRGQRLRQALEEGNVGAYQKDRRHVFDSA